MSGWLQEREGGNCHQDSGQICWETSPTGCLSLRLAGGSGEPCAGVFSWPPCVCTCLVPMKLSLSVAPWALGTVLASKPLPPRPTVADTRDPRITVAVSSEPEASALGLSFPTCKMGPWSYPVGAWILNEEIRCVNSWAHCLAQGRQDVPGRHLAGVFKSVFLVQACIHMLAVPSLVC